MIEYIPVDRDYVIVGNIYLLEGMVYNAEILLPCEVLSKKHNILEVCILGDVKRTVFTITTDNLVIRKVT